MKNPYAKVISASSKLWMLPLFVSLGGLFAFKDKTPGHQPGKFNVAVIANDTPRIKYFAKVDVKKTTGDITSVAVNDVKLFIINNRRYMSGELLYKYNEATLKADEMIVLPSNDENAMRLYGALSSKGVIEFKNAWIIPPMINAKNKPLYLLDGEEVRDVFVIRSLAPNNLKGISVFRDAHNTTEKYGDKAKYGVVEILTWTASVGEVMVEGVKDEGALPPVEMKTEEPSPDDPNKVWANVEIDASFKGGEAAWKRYLEANLDTKVPKKNGAPAATYTAWLQFIVEKDGTISDIKALSAHGFGIEEEAIRLVKTTTDKTKWVPADQNGRAVKQVGTTDGTLKTDSKWVPALQNGRPVRSYKKQPITFFVEE